MTSTHQHIFIPSDVENYDRCLSCGTLKRTDVVDHDELYKTGYWDREGYSNLEEQVYNLTEHKNAEGVSKIGAVLEYATGGESALEIGCAPGSMVKALSESYHKVCGIEFDSRYDSRIRKVCGDFPKLVYGSFPGITKNFSRNWFAIVAMDVLEHSDEPEQFLSEIHRLLSPSGVAVLMAPILLEDMLFDSKNYHIEHRFILTQKFLSEYLKEKFQNIEFTRWIVGHELIVLSNPINQEMPNL